MRQGKRTVACERGVGGGEFYQGEVAAAQAEAGIARQVAGDAEAACQLDDIADAVRYLVRATAVTGAVLPVDCGQRLSAMDRDVMFLDTDDPKRARQGDEG